MINENSITVEFEVHFREEEVSGYMYVEEADDEAPLRFYSQTGQEQWYIPSNPYRNPVNNHMMAKENDYEILVKTICECENFIQYLVDFQDEDGKEIVLDTLAQVDDVTLIIN